MRQQFLIVFLVPLMLIAGCQPAPGVERIRSVTVSGEGEVSVAPEVAVLRLNIAARDRDLNQAQARAGEVVTAVLDLTDALDISRERVQSTQLRVQPEYDWRDGKQEFRGYLVHREVRVELEDLAKIGPLVERAMSAGVNEISPPELGVKDPRALYREVLRFAAADAAANAEALVTTLDSKLGKVRRITAMEAGPPPQPKMEMQMMRTADSGAEESYETGRIKMRVQVQAEFELR